MGLKFFTIYFSELANYKFIRNDVRFFVGQKERALSQGIRLGRFFETGRGRVINQEYVQENEGEYPLYSSQTQDEGIFGYIDTYDFEGEYLTWTTDGVNAGRVFYRNGKFNCTNVCGTAKIKKNNKFEINLKFLPYFLNTITKYYVSVASGNPKLMNNVFEEIKIPLIPKSDQDQIVAQIEPIEKKVKELKAQVTPPQEIINKVFAREFGFDLAKFERLKKEKFFEVDFSKLSIYRPLRYDVKNQKYLNIFNNIIKNFGSSFFLKDIAIDKGKYGANEPAKDGEKGIDIRYIRITDIDSIGRLIDDDWKTTENIDKQYFLNDNDFLFARSGNTVGKTFLYDIEKHEEAIYAGYFIRFQLNFASLNKLFFLYYTKSFIYDFWVKGIVRIKGQPNINANEYLELKIPNISLTEQHKIVNKIKAELDKQKEIKSKIETERNKIDEIIEQANKF